MAAVELPSPARRRAVAPATSTDRSDRMPSLDDVLACPAYALIRFQGCRSRHRCSAATASTTTSLADVPLESGVPQAGRRFDRLLASRSARSASAASRRTTTAPRCRASRSRPSARSPSHELLAAMPDEPIESGRPRRLRHRRRRVRQARRADHRRRDRPGRGRQPRDRPALPRDRRRLGRRQGADRASGGCSSASAAPTGPSCSSPATATWSAPAPSGTSACTAATSG